MGLSDQERLRGMYYAICNITGVANEWRLRSNEDDFVEVRNLIDQLWHVFLGANTQGLLWILGPDSMQTIEGEPQSPWSLALVCKLEGKVKKALEGKVKKAEAEHDVYPVRPFNALDSLCITTLLKHNNYKGFAASCLLKAYQSTEDIMYYLRRYNDDFSDRYEGVSNLISKIQGECFRAFSERDCFAKAYLIHEMMKVLYGESYPYGDPDVVTSILDSEGLYHDFAALMNLPLEDLIPHHIELIQTFEAARKRTDNKERDDYELTRLRLFKVIEFSTKTHQYEHVRKKIVAKLESTDLAKEIPKVNKVWDQLKKVWEENKEAEEKRYDNQCGSPLDCYGFETYSIERNAKDAEKEIVPEPEPKKPTKKKKTKK